MDAKALLCAVRKAQGWPSNYRLARELGIPDNTIQRWNTGANAPDDATAARLAQLAGLDPDAVVAHMQAARAKTAEDRAIWQRIAQRLQTVAAAVACVILSGLITGSPDAEARARLEESASAPARAPVDRSTHCAQWLRRLAAAAGRWLVGFLQAAPA